ncbi:hypothetical protein G4228_010102 [Cervus hanglu yarkandensis]|nr:hypothetical protein G4228_010102 [Cervus hanglu yarkandensis]
MPDVRIPEREERRLPRQCNSQEGKFITDSSQDSPPATNAVVRVREPGAQAVTQIYRDSQYWRFTNDIKDAGYPKLISKGFGGLNGKIVAALSIAQYKNRPESVYFFKRGGSVQQYTYKQEPTQKCTGRRPAINYSVYGETAQVRRRRFERAIGPSQIHTIRIQYSPIRVPYQDKGFLHNEVKVSTLWRGLPNVVTSAISLPNVRKPDGYDYYAFSKDQYYNVDVPSRTARAITTRSGQTLSNTWYNCP